MVKLELCEPQLSVHELAHHLVGIGNMLPRSKRSRNPSRWWLPIWHAILGLLLTYGEICPQNTLYITSKIRWLPPTICGYMLIKVMTQKNIANTQCLLVYISGILHSDDRRALGTRLNGINRWGVFICTVKLRIWGIEVWLQQVRCYTSAGSVLLPICSMVLEYESLHLPQTWPKRG